MAVQIRETRVHNPNRSLVRSKTAKRTKSNRRKAGKRSNPSLLLMGPVNPHGGKKMARRKRKANSGRKSHRTRKSNPSTSTRRRRRNPMTAHRSRRRRSNPGVFRKGTDILQMGFWVVVGLALTRQIPQLLLGAKNSGVMGYIANIAVAIGAAWAAGSVGGEKAAMGAGAGGGAYVITRALQENMNPIGKYLSLQGLGDAMSLGEVYTGERAYFPTPMGYDNNGNPIIPSAIKPMALPAPASMPQGVGMYGGRRMRRAA